MLLLVPDKDATCLGCIMLIHLRGICISGLMRSLLRCVPCWLLQSYGYASLLVPLNCRTACSLDVEGCSNTTSTSGLRPNLQHKHPHIGVVSNHPTAAFEARPRRQKENLELLHHAILKLDLQPHELLDVLLLHNTATIWPPHLLPGEIISPGITPVVVFGIQRLLLKEHALIQDLERVANAAQR